MPRTLKTTVHVTDPDGTRQVLLAGSPVPDWAVDLIHESRISDTGQDDVQPDDDEPAEPTDTEPTEVERPNKSASKAEWVDYAVTQGADRDEAEATTKDDLVDRYGG